MIAIAKLTDVQLLGGNTIRAMFQANGAWGGGLEDSADGDLSSSLAQLGAAVKAKVIAWAATASVTLTPSQVLLVGFGDDQITGVRKIADDSTSSTSFSDVPGLSFNLAPNSHYKYKFCGGYTTALATTGLQLSVNGPASPNFMRAVGNIYTANNAPFAGAIGAYDSAIAATASGGATALPFEVEGTISTGAAGGAFSLRFRSEVNASAVTILRGSFGELISVG